MTTVIRIGTRLPDVALPDLDGDVVRLAGLRGRAFVLFAWASW